MSGSHLLCMFNRHRPLREAVHWNGLSYTGTCKRCGAPVRRLEAGGWRRRKHEPEVSE